MEASWFTFGVYVINILICVNSNLRSWKWFSRSIEKMIVRIFHKTQYQVHYKPDKVATCMRQCRWSGWGPVLTSLPDTGGDWQMDSQQQWSEGSSVRINYYNSKETIIQNYIQTTLWPPTIDKNTMLESHELEWKFIQHVQEAAYTPCRLTVMLLSRKYHLSTIQLL